MSLNKPLALDITRRNGNRQHLASHAHPDRVQRCYCTERFLPSGKSGSRDAGKPTWPENVRCKPFSQLFRDYERIFLLVAFRLGERICQRQYRRANARPGGCTSTIQSDANSAIAAHSLRSSSEGESRMLKSNHTLP